MIHSREGHVSRMNESSIPALSIPYDHPVNDRNSSFGEGLEQGLALFRCGMLRVTNMAVHAAIGHRPATGGRLEWIAALLAGNIAVMLHKLRREAQHHRGLPL